MEIDQATLNENEVDAPAQTMQETMAATLASMKDRDTSTDDVVDEAPKSDKPRAPDGKFAKVEASASQPVGDKKTSATAAAPDAGAQPVAEQPAAPTVQATVAPAPSSWTAEGKAEWAKLTPTVQKEVMKRESDFHRYYKEVEPMKQAAQYAQTLHKAIQPFERTLQGLGVTPDVAIHHLLATDHKMRYGSPQEKIAGIAAIAKGYGIDLSQGLPEAVPVDPNVVYFQQQQQQSNQALRQTQEQLQQLQAAEQRREKEAIDMALSQAKQGKPHFDALARPIGLILQAALDNGEEITIDEAYERALWQSPTHRTELLAKQQAERDAAEAKIRAEQAAQAQAARKASSVNVARRGTLPAQAPVGTMQETMAETLAAIRSR